MPYQPRRKSVVSASPNREAGAALITVLLFVMLVFILITAMLSVAGNEIVIAGLQRDGVRATELAQAGIQEAVSRVVAGRPYLSFTSSLAPKCPPPLGSTQCVTITIVNQYNGTGAAYLELRADATVGRATRRLSRLILAQATSYPPNVTFAASVSETGSAEITCGDAYSKTFLKYKNYPSNSCPEQNDPGEPKTLTYAGWRVSKANPGEIFPCYDNAGCKAANPGNNDVARWYPGTRQTTNPGTIDPLTSRDYGNEIQTWANSVDPSPCPASPPVSATKVVNAPDYQAGDKFATAPYANQLVSNNPTVPLYGFDTDGGYAVTAGLPCGFPYEWVRQEVYNEDTGVPEGSWWFKTIIFKQYLDRYWYFDDAELKFKKGADLASNPQYGAVPPFPDFASFVSNYDCKITGGGVINSLPRPCTLPDGSPSSTDLGCQNPPMSCSPTKPRVIVLEGDFTINGNIGGHGTLVVNGNLVVNGTFDYWGTIVVSGTLQAGTGNVNVYGGLVAYDTLRLIGNITVTGGSTVGGTPPAGPATAIGKAWWER